jgi:hypothetical protein
MSRLATIALTLVSLGALIHEAFAGFRELSYPLSENQVENLCAKQDGTFRTSEGGGYWCRSKTGVQIICNGKHICVWGRPTGDRGTVGAAAGNGLGGTTKIPGADGDGYGRE